MPRLKPLNYDVVTNLKELSAKADKIIQEIDEDWSGQISSLELYWDAVFKTMIEIRDAKSIKQLNSIPFVGMNSYLPEERNKKDDSAHPETVGGHSPVSSNREEKLELKTPCQLNTIQVKVDAPDTVECHVKPLGLMETPTLNRTFNKVVNETLVLNSAASSSTHPTIVALKSESVSTKISAALDVNGSGMITRSGSKRKSLSSHKQDKKRKISNSTARSAQPPRWPILEKNTKAATVPAVIVPSLRNKSVNVPKDKLVLEEIKKKEMKTNENIKRVAAEKKMKLAENKKLREEKMTKTKDKRMQLEKEKKSNFEAKNQLIHVKAAENGSLKKTGAKTRPQEQIEHHINKTKVLSTSKQNEVSVFRSPDSVVKTPANRKSSEHENYELTPMPDSSTYNFSDSEDESNPKAGSKRVPLWALGLQLKSALLDQYYNPIDTDVLFGVVDSPNLTEIFGVKKKHYLKRTSSAVWQLPPSK